MLTFDPTVFKALEFHDNLLLSFPKLVDASGYELLRILPNNNQKLCVIPLCALPEEYCG